MLSPLSSNMELASGALDIEAVFNDSVETDRNNTGVQSASLYVDGKLWKAQWQMTPAFAAASIWPMATTPSGFRGG